MSSPPPPIASAIRWCGIYRLNTTLGTTRAGERSGERPAFHLPPGRCAIANGFRAFPRLGDRVGLFFDFGNRLPSTGFGACRGRTRSTPRWCMRCMLPRSTARICARSRRGICCAAASSPCDLVPSAMTASPIARATSWPEAVERRPGAAQIPRRERARSAAVDRGKCKAHAPARCRSCTPSAGARNPVLGRRLPNRRTGPLDRPVRGEGAEAVQRLASSSGWKMKSRPFTGSSAGGGFGRVVLRR